MHDAIDCGKSLVNLAVDVALKISRLHVFLDWLRRLDLILYEIVGRAD